jgi:hypothetical protein
MAVAQQNQSALDAPDPALIGVESAQQTLSEVLVDSFEREGFWSARISPDDGIITTLLRNGSSEIKEALPALSEDEPEMSSDSNVLGVKVEFLHRGVNTFYITAGRPLPIEGEVKTVSVLVSGRNQPHKLSLVVQDYNGKKFELNMGTLDFSGWKKMTVPIPPSPDGVYGIVQSSVFYGDRPGLRIVGFKVDCDPMYARGVYYIYFDDLRAVTDLYVVESNRDKNDDIPDNW